VSGLVHQRVLPSSGKSKLVIDEERRTKVIVIEAATAQRARHRAA